MPEESHKAELDINTLRNRPARLSGKDTEGIKQEVKRTYDLSEKAVFTSWINELMESANAGLNEEQIDAGLKWFLANFEPREILFGPLERTIGEEAAQRPLQGEGTELLLKVRMDSERDVVTRLRWFDFLSKALVPTLARRRQEGAAPEELGDILMSALRPGMHWLGSDDGPLMMVARAVLQRQSEKDEGYYKTRGALADMLVTSSDPDNRQRATYLYDELLKELAPRMAKPTVGMLGMVNANANNLASVLNDLERDDLARQAMALSVVADAAGTLLGGETPELPDAKSVFLAFWPGIAEADAVSHALIVAEMANVPTVWRELVTDGQKQWSMVILLGALAGPVRAAIGAPEAEVAGALFNAGVSLHRAREKGAEIAVAGLVRACLNAAGLWWAIHSATNEEELRHSLHEGSGLDCADNFMGWLSALVNVREHFPELKTFTQALWARREGASSGEFFRLQGSLNKLGLREPSASEPPPDLKTALYALVSAVLSRDDALLAAWRRLHETGDAPSLAGFVAHGAQRALGKHYQELCGLLLAEIADLAQRAAEPARLFEGYNVQLPWQADTEKEWRQYEQHGRTLDAALRDLVNARLSASGY